MIRTPKPPAPRRPAGNADYIPVDCPQCRTRSLRTKAQLEQDQRDYPLTFWLCRGCRGIELDLVTL